MLVYAKNKGLALSCQLRGAILVPEFSVGSAEAFIAPSHASISPSAQFYLLHSSTDIDPESISTPINFLHANLLLTVCFPENQTCAIRADFGRDIDKIKKQTLCRIILKERWMIERWWQQRFWY